MVPVYLKVRLEPVPVPPPPDTKVFRRRVARRWALRTFVPAGLIFVLLMHTTNGGHHNRAGVLIGVAVILVFLVGVLAAAWIQLSYVDKLATRRWEAAVTERYEMQQQEIQNWTWTLLGVARTDEVWTIDCGHGHQISRIMVPAGQVVCSIADDFYLLSRRPQLRFGLSEIIRPQLYARGGAVALGGFVHVILRDANTELPPLREDYFIVEEPVSR